ncbi:hypothetical protein HDV63DRAFT_347552 [Trichoderma sp. SZMC 28014]
MGVYFLFSFAGAGSRSRSRSLELFRHVFAKACLSACLLFFLLLSKCSITCKERTPVLACGHPSRRTWCFLFLLTGSISPLQGALGWLTRPAFGGLGCVAYVPVYLADCRATYTTVDTKPTTCDCESDCDDEQRTLDV